MLSFAVTKAIASQETWFSIPLFRYADPLYLFFFQHCNAAHSDDKVEGLLPLWSETVHFDHGPHVHHRETFRYFNNCIAAFGLLQFAVSHSFGCNQVSSNEGAGCVAGGYDRQRAHQVALFVCCYVSHLTYFAAVQSFAKAIRS